MYYTVPKDFGRAVFDLKQRTVMFVNKIAKLCLPENVSS